MGSDSIVNLDNLPPVKELVKQGIEVNNPGKSQRELALECQFAPDCVSMLSMVKNGQAKMALGRVGVFAKVLRLDPTVLLLSALRERIGADEEAWESVRTVFNSVHTQEEKPLVDAIRRVAAKTGKKIDTSEVSIQALEAFIEKNMTL